LFSQCVEGDCKNGIGKYNYSNGDTFKGQFKDGKITGRGKITWSDGSNYDGEFIHNKTWGYGIYVWANGDVYEGNFLNNFKHGFGKLKYANGEVREGNWVAGQFTGKGKKTLITGENTEGYFVGGLWLDTNDTKYVKGFQTFTSETGSYTGNYIYGKTWGRGTLNWTSGASYSGEWINNKRTGKGIFKFKNGDVYEGEFVEDKMTGFGTLIKVNGEKKTGYWVDNNIILITDSQIANNNEIQQTSPNHTQNITSNSNLTVSTSKSNNPSTTKSIVKDADGKVYKTVVIGTQTWMAENLNVDRFRNGDLIAHAKTDEEWQKAKDNKQPAWCYYNNDPELGERYGKLYNWYAVNDSRGLAPKGWHISTKYDWTILTDYLGGASSAGYVLKQKENVQTQIYYLDRGGYDETKWVPCNNCKVASPEYKKICPSCKGMGGKTVKTGKYIPKYKERMERKVNVGWDGNNETGFNALRGGARYIKGFHSGNDNSCHSCGEANFWTSTKNEKYSYEEVWWIEIGGNSVGIFSNYMGESGLSVRCVKD